MTKTVSGVLSALLVAGAVSLAVTPGAQAAECYHPGSASAVIHDNHELAPAPADGVVHTGEQQLCKRGL